MPSSDIIIHKYILVHYMIFNSYTRYDISYMIFYDIMIFFFPTEYQQGEALKESWALPVFFNFFTNKKWFFPFFIKLIWLGVGFLNRTGTEIGN